MNFLKPPKYVAKLTAVQFESFTLSIISSSKMYDEKAIYRHLTICKRFTTI